MAAKEKVQKEAEDKAKLMNKLKIIQEKLVSGDLVKENERHEAEIRRRQAELEQKMVRK